LMSLGTRAPRSTSLFTPLCLSFVQLFFFAPKPPLLTGTGICPQKKFDTTVCCSGRPPNSQVFADLCFFQAFFSRQMSSGPSRASFTIPQTYGSCYFFPPPVVPAHIENRIFPFLACGQIPLTVFSVTPVLPLFFSAQSRSFSPLFCFATGG